MAYVVPIPAAVWLFDSTKFRFADGSLYWANVKEGKVQWEKIDTHLTMTFAAGEWPEGLVNNLNGKTQSVRVNIDRFTGEAGLLLAWLDGFYKWDGQCKVVQPLF